MRPIRTLGGLVVGCVVLGAALVTPAGANAPTPAVGTVVATLVLNSSANPGHPTQNILVDARFVTADGGVPTGTVTFRWARDPKDPEAPQSGVLGTATISNGVARVTTKALPATHPNQNPPPPWEPGTIFPLHIDATYSGDATYAPDDTAAHNPLDSLGEYVFDDYSQFMVQGQPGVGEARAQYIDNTYFRVLFRPPDGNGFDYWFLTLQAGAPLAALGDTLAMSDEYHAQVVQRVYQQYLRRAPDSASVPCPSAPLNYWVCVLRGSTTIEDFTSLIIGSNEYFFNEGGGTNDSWITAMYNDILGRDPDSGGRAYFQQLLAGGTSRTAVAGSIVGSTEHLSVIVAGFYVEFLLRSPDQAGVNYWVGLIQKHTARDEGVLGNILGSPEFFTNAAHDYPGTFPQPSAGAPAPAASPSVSTGWSPRHRVAAAA